ncbi:hypothetical protein TNCV_2672761 [Trichonephila clavipes]|nr:hypothetical protein TNCV_2672761 [Trichonephila clavipes]
MEERRKGGLTAPKRVRGAPKTQDNGELLPIREIANAILPQNLSESGGLEVTCPLRKPKVVGSIPAAVAEWYRYRIVACLVACSSPVALKTRRVGQRCTLNLSRAETSSRWCGS